MYGPPNPSASPEVQHPCTYRPISAATWAAVPTRSRRGHIADVEPRPQAESDLRNYFTAHPQENVELPGILAPIGDTARQCNTTVLSPDLESAYNDFMAG
jgi:heme-binding protein